MIRFNAIIKIALFLFLPTVLIATGCQHQPKVDETAYGEKIDHLPVIRDLPRYFPIMDEVETKPCRIRENVETAARRRLFESQGRDRELLLEEIEREKNGEHVYPARPAN